MKNLNDKELLEKTRELIALERKTLKEILGHLQEIYERRLFADLGYSSLFKYMFKELKYSEGAAARRIGALRLVKKVPEASGMIARGELNLSVASKAQSFTKDKTKNETREILDLVKGKTKDEADKTFFALTELTDGDTAVKADRTKRISENELRLQLTITDETRKKLKLVKDYYKCSSDEALNLALDTLLKQRAAKLGITNKSRNTKGRTIPAKIKKAVMIRGKSICEYPGCDETGNLEFEHLLPFAKGGSHEEKNIKIYCRTHNQRAAIKEFGRKKMDLYLN